MTYSSKLLKYHLSVQVFLPYLQLAPPALPPSRFVPLREQTLSLLVLSERFSVLWCDSNKRALCYEYFRILIYY